MYYGRYLGFDKAPHLWGGWGEMEYVDLGMLSGTKVYKIPDDMRLWLGTLAEPLTSCMRGFKRAQRANGFSFGDTVVIQGSGPIGVLAPEGDHRAERVHRGLICSRPGEDSGKSDAGFYIASSE